MAALPAGAVAALGVRDRGEERALDQVLGLTAARPLPPARQVRGPQEQFRRDPVEDLRERLRVAGPAELQELSFGIVHDAARPD
jgi:hypothetical protein